MGARTIRTLMVATAAAAALGGHVLLMIMLLIGWRLVVAVSMAELVTVRCLVLAAVRISGRPIDVATAVDLVLGRRRYVEGGRVEDAALGQILFGGLGQPGSVECGGCG